MAADDLDTVRRAAERTFTGLEPLIAGAADAALSDLAALIAAELDVPDGEVTAGIGGVLARVRRWWNRLADELLLAPILAVYETAAAAAARRFGAPPPPELVDLPRRHLDDPTDVPELVDQYLRRARNRLFLVGDSLWDAARHALADGEAEGETLAELTERLRRVFADHGQQLSGTRARRIARTETVAAWNRAQLDAARLLTEGRPVSKTWLATMDARTRPDHWRADRSSVALDEAFLVGGFPMQYPGDPAAPAHLVVQCRCAMTFDDDDARGDAGRQFLTDEQIAEVIRHYEEQGIVREVDRQASTTPTPTMAAAAGGGVVAAAGGYSGAMIALVPSADTVDRLALADGEPPEQLHTTLYYLGNGSDFTPQDRDRLLDLVAAYTAHLAPVEADAFSASAFNPHRDETALVLGLSGPQLLTAHEAILSAVDEYPGTLPDQYAPWVPHITLAYSTDLARLAEVADRAGPVVFDAVRVAFAGEVTDLPLGNHQQDREGVEASAEPPAVEPRRWNTPGDAALAYEDTQTGDGRVFAPGSLHWEDGPWPLQYADQMLGGHDGARLAGSIEEITRDGDRIPGAGVLYPDTPAGAEAIGLLERGAPLGVSVDLDDVDIEIVDRRPPEDRQEDQDAGEVVLLASLAAASFLRLPDGGWAVRATRRVEWATDQDGAVSAAGLADALTAAGLRTRLAPGGLAAAAGDRDDPDGGEVLMAERAGDYLMRVTRGRIRGATLVAMPAYHQARIALTDTDTRDTGTGAGAGVTAAAEDCDCEPGTMSRVVDYVSSSPTPVTAADVADALGISPARARGFLTRAATAGLITRVGRGRYTAAATLPETEVVAAASGDLDLPVHPDRDAPWDGPKAASRVLAWATGDDGAVDGDRLTRAFLWRDPDRDPATLAAYKLGFADVRDDRLVIIARGVFAVAGALSGARGGVDVPDADMGGLRDRTEDLYERLADAFDDPSLTAPWDDNDDRDDADDGDGEEEERMRELEASAWTAMRQAPPMPAAWFREPTDAELPPGSGGVHYNAGRIYGWVAQAGEPHAGMPGRNLTIESLGDIDLTHFLRAKFQLDDGSTVRAGSFTMNVGHHRDGAECETAACQFDDTRTVAGIVTVGLNTRGMWFSGAAAPWLAEWDRQVFTACQPSYHMRQGRDGRWQLRAVLSVPVPGHSSPLVASAVAERANLALAASAAAAPTPEPEPETAPGAGAVAGIDVQALAAALAPALVPALADELEQRERIRAEVDELAARLNPVRAELARGMAARVRQTV